MPVFYDFILCGLAFIFLFSVQFGGEISSVSERKEIEHPCFQWNYCKKKKQADLISKNLESKITLRKNLVFE